VEVQLSAVTNNTGFVEQFEHVLTQALQRVTGNSDAKSEFEEQRVQFLLSHTGSVSELRGVWMSATLETLRDEIAGALRALNDVDVTIAWKKAQVDISSNNIDGLKTLEKIIRGNLFEIQTRRLLTHAEEHLMLNLMDTERTDISSWGPVIGPASAHVEFKLEIRAQGVLDSTRMLHILNQHWSEFSRLVLSASPVRFRLDGPVVLLFNVQPNSNVDEYFLPAAEELIRPILVQQFNSSSPRVILRHVVTPPKAVWTASAVPYKCAPGAHASRESKYACWCEPGTTCQPPEPNMTAGCIDEGHRVCYPAEKSSLQPLLVLFYIVSTVFITGSCCVAGGTRCYGPFKRCFLSCMQCLRRFRREPLLPPHGEFARTGVVFGQVVGTQHETQPIMHQLAGFEGTDELFDEPEHMFEEYSDKKGSAPRKKKQNRKRGTPINVQEDREAHVFDVPTQRHRSVFERMPP
jgi:hypothetical protein